MNSVNLLMVLFGKSELLGLDMGFWVSMGVVTLLVVIMNVVFWGMKPKNTDGKNINDREEDDIYSM